MKLQIVGVGMGNPDTLTRQAERAIAQSDCLIGAQRMLEAFRAFAPAPGVSDGDGFDERRRWILQRCEGLMQPD